MLDNRQSELLMMLVENHIRTRLPVGSHILASRGSLDISSATVRNEMLALEDAGYVMQPHASAGRLPTEKGYRYYLAHSHFDHVLEERARSQMRHAVNAMRVDRENVRSLRNVAKVVSDLAEEAVVIGFSPYDIYWTGVTYLLAQPEFQREHDVIRLSRVLDNFDEGMVVLFKMFHGKEGVLIGKENPFSNELATVLARAQVGSHEGLFCIVGPLRMAYDKNIALVRELLLLLERNPN